MKTREFGVSFLLCVTMVFTIASTSHAAFVVVGSLQDEQGDPADWDPPNSSLTMTETGLGSGIYTSLPMGLTDGTLYEFKILDDQGDGAAWGDPELTPANVMAYGDIDNAVKITLDNNATNNLGNPVVWVDSDNLPLQVVGNFMSEAGGAGDWNPADPMFAMTNEGGGKYSYTATIDTAGTYEFKATDGTGWGFQVGPDGFNADAGALNFTVTEADQMVKLCIDVANQSLSYAVVPEPGSMGLLFTGLIGLLGRRRS